MRMNALTYCIGLAIASPLLLLSCSESAAAAQRSEPAHAPDDPAAEPATAASTAPEVQLEAIVVTANKRSQNLQDVPMAVTAMPGYQLRREHAKGFADYVANVPGFNIISSGPGQNQLVLRGITSGSSQSNATVGTYIDGIPYGSSTVYALGSLLTPNIDPADLVRIEVLRGPQGTLYGSNTLGGLIKFVTVPPNSRRTAGRVRMGYTQVSGGGHGYSVHAMGNLPLITDELALRVNAYHNQKPGYIDNVATGKSDVNEATVDGARLQLLWTPSEDLSVRLSALAQDMSGDGLANVGVDVYADTLEPIHGDLTRESIINTGLFDLKQRLYSVMVKADLGWADLVSASSYSRARLDMVGDLTAAYGPVLGPVLGVPDAGFVIHQPVNLDKYTQEFRLESPGHQSLEWRLGLYYTHERSTNHQVVTAIDKDTGATLDLPLLADATLGPARFTEWAGYGDVTWHAGQRFSVTLGARYSHDETTYEQSGAGLLVGNNDFTIEGSAHATTYLINPSFQFSDDVMGYVRIASGFRPGGPNVGLPPGLEAPDTFGPDKLVSYEAGLKSSLLDHRMRLDVAAFYIDWTEIQIAVVKGGFNYLGNGGQARSRGVELSWQYTPVTGLFLSGNAAWTDATLTEDTPPGLFGSEGDRLPYVPEWKASLGFDYDFPMSHGWSGFVGGRYSYVGERVSDFLAVPAPRTRLDSYHQVDVRAGVNRGPWTLSLYVKNLTDERGISSITPQTTVATASPFAATYIRPRTMGISFSIHF